MQVKQRVELSNKYLSTTNTNIGTCWKYTSSTKFDEVFPVPFCIRLEIA